MSHRYAPVIYTRTKTEEHASIRRPKLAATIALKMLRWEVQISNATTVHVRAPGNPKKWRAKVLCDGKVCDLALLTVKPSS